MMPYVAFWLESVLSVALVAACIQLTLTLLRANKVPPKRGLVVSEPEFLVEADDEPVDVEDSWLETESWTRYSAACDLCDFKMRGVANVTTPTSTNCPGCSLGELVITIFARGLPGGGE